MNLLTNPTRRLLLARVSEFARAYGEPLSTLCRRTLRGTPREVLSHVDAFVTVYIVWSAVLMGVFGVAVFLVEAVVDERMPQVLVACGIAAASFPLAMASSLVCVIVWQALFHRTKRLDLDPRKPSRHFRVADIIGYVFVCLLTAMIMLL